MSSPQMLEHQRFDIPRSVVMTNRIIWGALLLGQLSTAAVLAGVVAQGKGPPTPPPNLLLMVGIDAGLLAVAIVVVVVVRAIGFRGASGDAAVRARYSTGMIVPMACLEGASFLGIIVAFLSGHLLPAGIVPATALAIQLTLFPRARVKLWR